MKFLRQRKDLQSGQAIVLIALAFVGLAAFIGLATDVGILFSSVGNLRRAVDAAALSASNQFREDQEYIDIKTSARQFIKINLPAYDPNLDDPPDNPCRPEVRDLDGKFICDIAVRVQTCENDVTLCPPDSQPKKLVRVEADMRVDLAFLRIIGWEFTVITANAISEAGSVDLVLVIDTSPSMSYDLCNDGRNNDVNLFNPVTGEGPELDVPEEEDDCAVFNGETGSNKMSESDVATCTAATDPLDQCEPFETVRDDAKILVGLMNFPYDHVGIVRFGREAEVILPLDGCDFPDKDAKRECIWGYIDSMNVELEPLYPPDPETTCPGWPPNPSGCTSTNTGDGLRLAGNLFADNDNDEDPWENDSREDAVWVVVLLSDGVANAGINADVSPPEWICPLGTWFGDGPPYCQDGVLSEPLAPPRLDSDPKFDAEDHARKMALFVGCPSELLEPPGIRGPCTVTGNQAVIFTICLGDACINYDRGGEPEDSENRKIGGELLQFIAAITWVADELPGGDPCADFGPEEDCGNYFFVADKSKLEGVFEEIASRIYTKLNH